MDDKPPPFAELFGTALKNLGEAIIQSVDDALLASRGPAQLTLPDDDEQARTLADARDDLQVRTARQVARDPDAHNLARAYVLADSPCVDFGRCIERIPAVSFRPSTVDAVQACLSHLTERRLEAVARGAATTTGGQALARGKHAVLDLRALDAVEWHPERDEVTVGAGQTWTRLVNALRAHGRIVPVVPWYSDATVGGTVATGGGVGESSHRAGLACDHVVALTVVAPDGDVREVRRGAAAFDDTVGGLGKTGVIVSVTLATRPRPQPDVLRVRAGWESVAHFVDDAISVIEDEPDLDILTARRTWDDDFPVVGTLGRLATAATDCLDLERLGDLDAELGEVRRRRLETVLLDRWRWLPSETCAPSLSMLLPLPRGLEALKRIESRLGDARLLHAMPRGTSLFVLPRTGEDAYDLFVDLRPMVLQHRVRNVLRVLAAIADEVESAGGRVLPTGSAPLFERRTPR